ncbi:MAG: transglutaminase-like domain-containing protein [Patescibacteria group bacterium]
MTRKILTFLFVFSTFFLLASFLSSCQAKEFASFYKTTYTFDKSGETYVTQEISLVNQTSEYYVSEYSLSIVGGEISKIEAYDKVGPLKISTIEKDLTTIITLNFNEKVVGKEKVLSFILKYRARDLAKKEGNLWQISIPKLANYEEIDDYQAELKIPKEFGKVAFINPNPSGQEDQGDFLKLFFEKSDLTSFGVLVTLGQYQTFDFKIIYDLPNPHPNSLIEKISLPPDTNYQTVYYQNLNPKPANVEVDADGNWLALYEIPPKQTLQVVAEGQVNIFSQSKNQERINLEDREKYLAPTNYWQASDQKIRNLALELKTPENIYNYLVKTLEYDYSEVKKGAVRKGAVKTLDEPHKSICTDFTDLFIALARAAGIPARELDGFAYTENSRLSEIAQNTDLLHSWPEYFDEARKRWVMVDPTWGNTSSGLDYFNKFDMTHFVFVIHGLSDTLPYSPGAYRQSTEGKQILVAFAQEEIVDKPRFFEIEEVEPKHIFSLKNNQIRMVLRNTSGFFFDNERISLSSQDQISNSDWSVQKIPPFSKFEITYSLKPEEKTKDYQTDLVLKIEDHEVPFSILINSLLLRAVVIGGGVLALILFLLLKGLGNKNKTCPEIADNAKVN